MKQACKNNYTHVVRSFLQKENDYTLRSYIFEPEQPQKRVSLFERWEFNLHDGFPALPAISP
jgi:hypothetical protein